MDIIYKILTLREWQDLQKTGNFKGSALDRKDGFIHGAFHDQYPAILEKFFKGIRPVVLVKLDSKLLLVGGLKIESNRVGGTQYPHIYGDILFNYVIDHEILD
jgi:uncharacterized protein (DUF952 family)